MMVSVLMGVYNAADTVERAMNSLLRQTFSPLEILVCDDASTDGSLGVLRALQERHPDKIRLLQNAENQGLGATLNTCFAHATGDYIARMDADDVSLPMRIQQQADFLESHPAFAMVGCNAEKFDEQGIYGELRYPKAPQPRDFLWNNPFLHPSMLIRAAVLRELGGYDPRNWCKRCEDYELWMRLYAAGYRGYNLPDILFQYYEGQENLIKRKYRYRITEARVRFRGFRDNKMLLRGLPYVVKPLLVGLLPGKMLREMKKKRKLA